MASGRFKIYRFSSEIFFSMLTNKHLHVSFSGIPSDGKLVASGYDFETDQFWIKVESQTFPELSDGSLIPFGEIIVSRLNCGHKDESETMTLTDPVLDLKKEITIHQAEIQSCVDQIALGMVSSEEQKLVNRIRELIGKRPLTDFEWGFVKLLIVKGH